MKTHNLNREQLAEIVRKQGKVLNQAEVALIVALRSVDFSLVGKIQGALIAIYKLWGELESD